MKTDLLMLAGLAVALMAAPMVSHAEEDTDWAARSPLAFGEPMEDCDIHHSGAVATTQLALPEAKVEEILATPDLAPAVAPAAAPIVAPLPAKASPDKTTRAAPRALSPATLLTFALIASPGTTLPQTGGRD